VLDLSLPSMARQDYSWVIGKQSLKQAWWEHSLHH
jgi:hypothetical protein